MLVLGTQAFLHKTVTGRAMQAVAQNTESATVLGINVPRMIFYTFAINAVLACAAALLVTPTYLAKFDMGESLGTKAFFAAIIGGFNNSRGALLGGADRRRQREPGRGLHLADLQGRGRAGRLHARDPVQAAGPAGQEGRAQGLRPMKKTLARRRRRRRCSCCSRVPPFLKSYGIYLFSYWLVFVIARWA